MFEFPLLHSRWISSFSRERFRRIMLSPMLLTVILDTISCHTAVSSIAMMSLWWAASPAFEPQSLPQMQHACPVDVARVCLLSWAHWSFLESGARHASDMPSPM
ncbi:uncharacterized protein LOC141885812 [Acropora palmata]|uniref:uncharacterized protein LOC141885812 n=1 Tax=Acropora palmata TaxID=6131 RepID=UPI003D9FCB4B